MYRKDILQPMDRKPFRVLLTSPAPNGRLLATVRYKADPDSAVDTYAAAIRWAEKEARTKGREVRIELQHLERGRWLRMNTNFNGMPDAAAITVFANGTATWHPQPVAP